MREERDGRRRREQKNQISTLYQNVTGTALK
jgi:hypothetical protein